MGIFSCHWTGCIIRKYLKFIIKIENKKEKTRIILQAVTWSNSTFSLLFHDFLASLGNESSALVILITGTYQSMGNFTGLLAGALLKKFSLRTVGLFGGIVFCIGSILTIFVGSVAHIFFAFSILQGEYPHWCTVYSREHHSQYSNIHC